MQLSLEDLATVQLQIRETFLIALTMLSLKQIYKKLKMKDKIELANNN